ncbi:MAG: carboxypeptidase-like regulatory domain-containing protein [Cyclobacteriaceae bacterium]
MMRGVLIYFFLIALVFPRLILAQTDTRNITGEVSGTVKDESGQVLPFATATLKGTTKGTLADESGEFSMKDIPVGRRTLQIAHAGFESQEIAVDVIEGRSTSLEVVLKESVSELENVVIVGESETQRLERSAQAITVVELKTAKLRTADLGVVLARTEGVAIQRAGGLGSGTRLSLNGLTDDQVRIFVDDIPLEFAGRGLNVANVSPNLIDRIEVYKGVVPARFGSDALGGAVNLVTSTPQGNDLNGMASYQIGSFGTHRIAAYLGKADEESGFFVKGSGFFDFARNNYDIQVQFANASTNFQQVEVTVPRFHDAFRQYGSNITVGLKGRKWADEVSLEFYFLDEDRQIQSNPVQTGLPYGGVELFSESMGANLRYQKQFSENLTTSLVGGYNETAVNLQDLSTTLFNWFGEPVTINRDIIGEISREIRNGIDRTIFDNNYFARFLTEWSISDQHSLELVIAPTFVHRTGENAVIEEGADVFDTDATLQTWINGLTYKFLNQENSFENQLFVKNYRQNKSFTVPVGIRSISLTGANEVNDWGFGNVARFTISDQLSTKLSYEWSVRLPRTNEAFGDGRGIIGNPELKPERSHNVNLELFLRSVPGRPNSWTLKFNSFLRATDDLIFFIPQNNFFSTFENVLAATSIGGEVRGTATFFKEKLSLDWNSTYFSFRNTSSEGIGFEGDRIPNRPYLFVNAAANYRLKSLLSRYDEINFFGNARFVESFFRTWESIGNENFKPEIPSQTTFNAGITYNMPMKVNSSLTAEIQNLTNETVFDFFGVQRPGRAFFVKLTGRF